MIEASNLTNQRIGEFLAEGKRFDGRKLDEFREIVIENKISKKAEGSAKVKIGKTEVWVGVKLGVTEPYPDSPDQGSLMVTAELTPLSHAKYDYGPPKFEAIELGRLVDRGIRESKVIDLKKLCIKEGEKVWNVFIDIYSINDDGNLLDAAFIATLAALKEAKIPEYDLESGKIDYEKHTKNTVPLTNNFPFNFSIYKVGKSFFIDPTIEEEGAAEGRLTLGVIPGKPIRVCSMQKSESMELSVEDFAEILELVEKKYDVFSKEVLKKIDESIKKSKA